MVTSDPAVRWLLDSPDPSVRYFTLTEVAGVSPHSAQARRVRAEIPRSARLRALLRGQRADGGFGVHPYKKWNGAHWRLVSLVELGIPPRHTAARHAVEQVLRWLQGPTHRSRIVRLRGLWRRCASQEGNALRVCAHLGLARDPRVRRLVADMLEWQWPDGGWNCDRRPEADHASFHESLIPLWALAEYRGAAKDRSVDAAIERATEFFLRHRLFRAERDGAVIADRRATGRRRTSRHPQSPFLQLAYPPYWHYDILTALRVMERLGRLGDPRVQEALDLIQARRGPEGLWRAEARYWRAPGSRGAHTEVVDWGPAAPSEMVTLNALRVLKASGRLP